jgi:hypothetical protein
MSKISGSRTGIIFFKVELKASLRLVLNDTHPRNLPLLSRRRELASLNRVGISRPHKASNFVTSNVGSRSLPLQVIDSLSNMVRPQCLTALVSMTFAAPGEHLLSLLIPELLVVVPLLLSRLCLLKQI